MCWEYSSNHWSSSMQRPPLSRNTVGGYGSSGTGSDSRTTSEQVKSAIPGTAEHDSSRTGYGSSQGHGTGQGYDTRSGSGQGSYGSSGQTSPTGYGGTGSERRTTGEKLQAAIPGTAEHDRSRAAGHGGSQGYSGSQGQEYDTRSTLPSSTHHHGGYSGSQGTGSDRHQHGASAAGEPAAAAHAHLAFPGQHSELGIGCMPALASCAPAAQICTHLFEYILSPAGAGAGVGAGIGALEHGRHHGGQDSQAGYDSRHTGTGNRGCPYVTCDSAAACWHLEMGVAKTPVWPGACPAAAQCVALMPPCALREAAPSGGLLLLCWPPDSS